MKKNATHIFANDPDADRLSIAELIQPQPEPSLGDKYRIFNGNEIAAIIMYVLVKDMKQTKLNSDRNDSNGSGVGKKVAMLASCVSLKLMRRVCELEGFEYRETLTGFKYLGIKARDLESSNYNVSKQTHSRH